MVGRAARHGDEIGRIAVGHGARRRAHCIAAARQKPLDRLRDLLDLAAHLRGPSGHVRPALAHHRFARHPAAKGRRRK
jgi:hypothetical protein